MLESHDWHHEWWSQKRFQNDGYDNENNNHITDKNNDDDQKSSSSSSSWPKRIVDQIVIRKVLMIVTMTRLIEKLKTMTHQKSIALLVG